MNRIAAVFLTLALCLAALAACGGSPATAPVAAEPTAAPTAVAPTAAVVPSEGVPAQPTATEPIPEPQAGIEVQDITFAHGLSEQMEPVEPGDQFGSADTVYLSVKIKGRPKSGMVKAAFSLGEIPIAEASVDLAEANSGVLFSVGESTFAGYTLTHADPFPLSDNYRADLFYDDMPIGTVSFSVVPPPDAIPSQVTEVVLAHGTDETYAPVEPGTVFSQDQQVHLVGRGDLGLETWLEADWYVGGELDDAGTRSITLEENAEDVPFAFSYLPEGGWPEGEHFVVLTMNDREVGRYSFTITPAKD